MYQIVSENAMYSGRSVVFQYIVVFFQAKRIFLGPDWI